MNLFVFSDESGVFDRQHNDIYVFAGLILLSSESKEEWSRKYSAAERRIRISGKYRRDQELKASLVTNSEKLDLYKSLNGCHKFAVVIRQQKLLGSIFESKKDKQRYLDYAYKIGVRRALERLVDEGLVNPSEVENMYFFVDEPQGYRYYGSLVAAPYVGQIFSKIFEYKKIAASEETDPITYFEMPDLMGLTAGEASRVAEQLGLNLEIVGIGGYVIAQYPSAGEVTSSRGVALVTLSQEGI